MSLKKTLTMAVTSAMLLTAGLAQAVENGVVPGAAVETALPNFTNFDPPSSFGQSLPLKGFYLNSETKMNFTAGNGIMLNSDANFDVIGFSPPNFLAFNCLARNSDGTSPALPMQITFSSLVSQVSMKVGKGPGIVALAGFDKVGRLLAQASINATGTMQTLQISRPGIKRIQLSGPCILVVDDISAS
jgi:hypothetical protein